MCSARKAVSFPFPQANALGYAGNCHRSRGSPILSHHSGCCDVAAGGGPRQHGAWHIGAGSGRTGERGSAGAAFDGEGRDDFRASLAGMTNPYGDGHAAETIVQVLVTTPLGDPLLIKHAPDAG